MNTPVTDSKLVIVMPLIVAMKVGELAKRLSVALNEPIETSRRCVELSVLVHGVEGVEKEIEAVESGHIPEWWKL